MTQSHASLVSPSASLCRCRTLSVASITNGIHGTIVTPLVRAFFYIYNDHARTVLLSTFTLLFTVTGDLEKTWRAQNRQILLVRSQNILINSSNELRSYVNKLFLVTYEYDSVSFFFYKQNTKLHEKKM